MSLTKKQRVHIVGVGIDLGIYHGVQDWESVVCTIQLEHTRSSFVPLQNTEQGCTFTSLGVKYNVILHQGHKGEELLDLTIEDFKPTNIIE